MDKEVRDYRNLVILQDILIRNVVEKIDVDDVSNTDLDDLLASLYDYTIMISSYLAKKHISVSSSFDKAYAEVLTSEAPEAIQKHFKDLTALMESSEFKALCK